MRNDVNSTTKSIEESNNRIINELSEIKSSISGSSILPAVTTKSIKESNNQIINELSEIKSSISGSFPSNLFSGIISGALVAAIVSAVAFFVLLRVYSNSGIKLSELKLRRRNNSNYT
jgi:predicted PurR-regulated permease PerM